MIFNSKIIFIVLATFIFASCSKDGQNAKANNNEFETQVIYGEDDRRDWYEANSAFLPLADATVALFSSSDVSMGSHSATLRTSNPGWCSDEPFQNQGTGAFCSGFLVGPDLVVTAGHCIRSQSSCNGIKFVFGFALKSRNHDFRTVPSSDVYGCSQLIASKVENTGTDYAVVKLDRPVTNHTPLNIRRSGEITRGTNLVVIGHPAGLPSKVADGAQVRSVSSSYFVANLDTYGGNSGSAVFNTQTGTVEGILVRGDNDFVYRNGCTRSNVCSNNGCRGEDVTKITEVLSYVPELTNTPVEEPAQEEEQPEEEIPSGSALFTANANMAIPDDSRNGLASTLNVNQSVAGRNILVHLDIRHTYIGDLVIGLKGPSGKTVILRNNQGGSMRNLVGIYGDNLIPTQDLAQLSNEQAGQWQLIIMDTAYMDIGRLNSWSIEFK